MKRIFLIVLVILVGLMIFKMKVEKEIADIIIDFLYMLMLLILIVVVLKAL